MPDSEMPRRNQAITDQSRKIFRKHNNGPINNGRKSNRIIPG